MPKYSYIREDNGKRVDLFMGIDEMERREKKGKIVLECGVVAERTFSGDGSEFKDTPANWRFFLSDGLGVHPDQIPEETKRLNHSTGFDNHFCPDGRLRITSRKHRKAVLSACGMHDRDGGYGD